MKELELLEMEQAYRRWCTFIRVYRSIGISKAIYR